MADRIAPDDGIWVCAACGKTAVDRYGINGPHTAGWDESCALNAVLCNRDGIAPGERVTIKAGRKVKFRAGNDLRRALAA